MAEIVCVLGALLDADVVSDKLAVVFALTLTDVESVELTEMLTVDDTVTDTALLSVLEPV